MINYSQKSDEILLGVCLWRNIDVVCPTPLETHTIHSLFLLREIKMQELQQMAVNGDLLIGRVMSVWHFGKIIVSVFGIFVNYY